MDDAADAESSTGRPQLTADVHSSTGGFELVFTPLVFGLIGFGLDQLLDTLPWLTIILTVLAFVGVVIRLVMTYGDEMDAHEANR